MHFWVRMVINITVNVTRNQNRHAKYLFGFGFCKLTNWAEFSEPQPEIFYLLFNKFPDFLNSHILLYLLNANATSNDTRGDFSF